MIIVLTQVLIILLLIFLNIKKKENFRVIDTIDSVTKEECNLLIDVVLSNINDKFNKNLIRGNLDSVEKTYLDNSINYKINVFIYNNDKFTNKKIFFDITYDNKHIILNKVKNGVSREILNIERDAITSRGSIVFKPKVNIDLVKKNNNIKFDYSNFNIPETNNKMVNRNKWVLDNDANSYKNNIVFPNKFVKKYWDCFGIAYVNDKGCGLNHSSHKFEKIPNFFINNYAVNSDIYDWMFNPAEDSASRPIGITGATG